MKNKTKKMHGGTGCYERSQICHALQKHDEEEPVKIQFFGEHHESNWLNITPDQARAIADLLDPMPVEPDVNTGHTDAAIARLWNVVNDYQSNKTLQRISHDLEIVLRRLEQLSEKTPG